MTFSEDFRTSNPGLHRLYVRWALETMAITDDALEELEARSQVQASTIAYAIRENIREECQRNAAWFEAAALRYIQADVSSYFTDDE